MSDERDALYVRKRSLRRELRERGIPRDHWADIHEAAEEIKSLAKLDDYLDLMEANLSTHKLYFGEAKP